MWPRLAWQTPMRLQSWMSCVQWDDPDECGAARCSQGTARGVGCRPASAERRATVQTGAMSGRCCCCGGGGALTESGVGPTSGTMASGVGAAAACMGPLKKHTLSPCGLSQPARHPLTCHTPSLYSWSPPATRQCRGNAACSCSRSLQRYVGSLRSRALASTPAEAARGSGGGSGSSSQDRCTAAQRACWPVVVHRSGGHGAGAHCTSDPL